MRHKIINFGSVSIVADKIFGYELETIRISDEEHFNLFFMLKNGAKFPLRGWGCGKNYEKALEVKQMIDEFMTSDEKYFLDMAYEFTQVMCS